MVKFAIGMPVNIHAHGFPRYVLELLLFPFSWQQLFGLLFWHLICQGGIAQVRFQPRVGQFLAAAAENVVSIFDVESDRKTYSLQVLQMKLV